MTVDRASQLVVERVGRPVIIEAVRMLEAGEGSILAIDAALLAAGYRDAPFGLLDDVGLDLDLAIDRALQVAVPMSGRFDPPDLQVELVEDGRVGRVCGRGFYRYDVDGARVPDVVAGPGHPLSPEAIVERLELGVINEAYRVAEDGLASPPFIDAAMREAGHPYGPFERLDQLGMRRVIERLQALFAATEERSDDQYRVATTLWQMATV
jgi:3-hydroxyacyl-CoA dehydrogenase